MDSSKLVDVEFEDSLRKSIDVLCEYSNYIPFYAFTYGRYRQDQLDIVRKFKLSPVLISGRGNYNNSQVIDRELLDGKRL